MIQYRLLENIQFFIFCRDFILQAPFCNMKVAEVIQATLYLVC